MLLAIASSKNLTLRNNPVLQKSRKRKSSFDLKWGRLTKKRITRGDRSLSLPSLQNSTALNCGFRCLSAELSKLPAVPNLLNRVNCKGLISYPTTLSQWANPLRMVRYSSWLRWGVWTYITFLLEYAKAGDFCITLYNISVLTVFNRFVNLRQ